MEGVAFVVWGCELALGIGGGRSTGGGRGGGGVQQTAVKGATEPGGWRTERRFRDARTHTMTGNASSAPKMRPYRLLRAADTPQQQQQAARADRERASVAAMQQERAAAK